MDFGEHISGIQSTIVDPSLPHGKFLFDILHSRVVLLKVLQQLVQFVVNVGLVLHVDELVHLDEYINTMAMTRVVRIHKSFSITNGSKSHYIVGLFFFVLQSLIY